MLSFLSSLYQPLWLQHPVSTVQKGNDTHSPPSNLNFVEISDMIETLMTKLVESDNVDGLMIGGIVKIMGMNIPRIDVLDVLDTDMGETMSIVKTGENTSDCMNMLDAGFSESS